MQYGNGYIFANDYSRAYSPGMSIADRLNEVMQESQPPLSQSALKRISGVPQPTINRILKGTVGKKGPETETIKKLAAALNVTFEWLNEGILPKYRNESKTATKEIKIAVENDVSPIKPETYAEMVELFGYASQDGRTEALRILRASAKRKIRRGGAI